jgi:hypothetical protein
MELEMWAAAGYSAAGFGPTSTLDVVADAARGVSVKVLHRHPFSSALKRMTVVAGLPRDCMLLRLELTLCPRCGVVCLFAYYVRQS